MASFVDALKQSRSDGDAEAYDVLINLAPEFLKGFTRRDGLAVERYYREAITRADRKTAPIAGSLLLSENRKRLLDVLWVSPRLQCPALSLMARTAGAVVECNHTPR